MSTIYDAFVACAGCGRDLRVRVADSLNANRMPDARIWVLERSLSTVTCECGTRTTAVKPVLYVDFQRGLWTQVYPEEERGGYEAAEVAVRKEHADAFDTTKFPRFVEVLARQVAPRLVFGYEELREKVVAADAALDDRILEVMKLEILVVQPQLLAQGIERLVLDRIEGDALRFRLDMFESGHGVPAGELVIRREVYDALARDAAKLRTTYPALFEGVYVSALRYRQDTLPA